MEVSDINNSQHALKIIKHSRALAVGFHCERYGENSPPRTLSFSLQFYFAVSIYLYVKIQTASLGTARWVDLSTHLRLVLR